MQVGVGKGSPSEFLFAFEIHITGRVLITHGSVYGASNCTICGVARCPDWVNAYDRLAAAGLLMTEAPVWESYKPRGRG